MDCATTNVPLSILCAGLGAEGHGVAVGEPVPVRGRSSEQRIRRRVQVRRHLVVITLGRSAAVGLRGLVVDVYRVWRHLLGGGEPAVVQAQARVVERLVGTRGVE
jgi:hypothetical protein